MSRRFPVTAPDVDYWKRQINCQAACPVHTDARGYVRAIADGDTELAYLIARGPNPLASICGHICGAPCEAACRRGQLDAPVAIRALKRFACERSGLGGTGTPGVRLVDILKRAAGRAGRECEGGEELLPLMQSLTRGDVRPVQGLSVGIVGGGPAGLAAAHDLALLGFKVTIYETEATLAGMLAVGVPEYRLPRDLIREEVAVILGLGVEAVTGCLVGRDVSLSELRARHDAVIVAVGLKRSRHLSIPGADAPGVMGGVEFLRDVALQRPPDLGTRVVVIGGGNVAYDVGRTVLRQTAVDAARTALRGFDVGQVFLCSLESLAEMPADLAEIHEGDEEGIVRRNGWGPVEILTNGSGRVAGVVFRQCLQVYDAERRFAPRFDDAVRELIECDSVILSVGQVADIGFLDEGLSIDRHPNGSVVCDPTTGATSLPGLFVAGDLAHGAKLLIHAVASGKRVARSVYEALTGLPIRFEDTALHFELPGYGREAGYEARGRTATRSRPVAERLASLSATVELGFDEAQARCEASRCLDCGVNTLFDGEKCIACGGCVDVCPQACLYLVPLSALDGLDGPVTSPGHESQAGAMAIVKDETVCIRCGLCATRCPATAITMERFRFSTTPVAG